jgi:hypothetical protein
MRAVFVISMTCAFMSLLAVFALSAMTIAPRPDGESFRACMMLVAGAFFVAWLCLAFWIRARQRASALAPPPKWLSRLLVSVGIVYLLGAFLLFIG